MFECLFTVQVQKTVQKNSFFKQERNDSNLPMQWKKLIKSAYSNLNYLTTCSVDLITLPVGEGNRLIQIRAVTRNHLFVPPERFLPNAIQ